MEKPTPAEILMYEHLVQRYREAFSGNVLPTNGRWEQDSLNPKIVRGENSKVLFTAKTVVDAGYISAVQPVMLINLLDYITYLENQLKDSVKPSSMNVSDDFPDDYEV